jgi:3-hydroxyisobutyrate dehydrogenase
LGESIGFIGLGIMGTPMCRHLLKAGYPVTAWNRTASRLQPLITDGAGPGISPADVASKSTITMVGDSGDVEAVIAGKDGVIEGATKGSVVIDMSTISPVTSRSFSRRLPARGV